MTVSRSSHSGVSAMWTIDNPENVPSKACGWNHFTDDVLPISYSTSADNKIDSFEEPTLSVKTDCIKPDLRSRVEDRDLEDGGKFRSIVKLVIRYEGQDERDAGSRMATGWLIRSDIVVTAGSNVFDWTNLARPLGKAMQIKCYIGYHGGSSVGTPSVQFRLAKVVVTTPEWLAGPDNRHRDIAFLKLDRPFEGNLRLFEREETTPVHGHFMLGVVGYPGDKGRDAGLYDEYGGEMYEMFTTQKYNLHDPPSHNAAGLLEYDISTRGGQAGSPVLRKDVDSMTVIGTHVHRAGEKGQANLIGHHGNDYNMMLEAFDVDLPVISDSNGIRLVQHPISMPIQSPGDFDIISPGSFDLASPASTVLETPIDCDSWVAVSRKGFPVGGAVPPHLIKTSMGQGLSLGHGVVGPLTPPDENIIRLPVGNLLEVFESPVSPGGGF